MKKKVKKKVLLLMLVFVLSAIALISCGNKKETPSAAAPAATPEAKPIVEITAIDKVSRPEVVTLENRGKADAVMTGWKIVSVNMLHPNDPNFPDETYNFPDGFVLKAGATIKILSDKNAAPGDGILVWDQDSHWYNKDKNNGVLYNNKGEKVFEFVDTTADAAAASPAPAATAVPAKQ